MSAPEPRSPSENILSKTSDITVFFYQSERLEGANRLTGRNKGLCCILAREVCERERWADSF